MKKSILSLFIISVLMIALRTPARAQYILKEADAQYELFNYTKAIDLYEQAYKKKATLHAAEHLAACYAFTQNYKQTESWYAAAINIPGSSAENYLHYAKALQNNSKYSEARIAYQKYASLNKQITSAQQELWIQSCDSAVKWMNTPGNYTIRNERALNSPKSDWAAVKYNNGVVYTSDRGHLYSGQGKGRPFLKFDGAKVPDKKMYGWTGSSYLHLYIKESGSDSSKFFPLHAGTDYHVGPACFSKDGKEIYFAATRIPKHPVYEKGKMATVNVEIYSSKKDENSGLWSEPVAFKYNNVSEWSVGDPYLTEDGNALYFVSNMPGGRGGTDIYVSNRTQDGWGVPANLVDINTEGNERSPAFDGDNNFYFSSDGYPGMGGLDIFKTVNRHGKMDMPQNLGYPFNSPQDDFSYTSNSVASGYFASNREEGAGEDDIYSYKARKILRYWLTGIAYDKKSDRPLNNVIVSLSKKDGSTLKVQTSADGTFKFNLDEASAYQVTGEKTNYTSDMASLTTANLADSTTLRRDLFLKTIVLDKAIRLENIYYDFDKWNIRPDAAVELDKLVIIMRNNPTIWIELGSHTDSRGNDNYNMSLSQKRAESAVQYIISRGINRNRITAKGYGESQLLNQCANGVQCTVAEHQLNRRTEFKIVKQ